MTMNPQQVPLIGQQRRAAEAAITQAVQGLSVGIYSHLATAYIATLDRPHQAVDVEHLRELGRDSMAAAQAYFEGLGIAQFTKQQASQ